MIDIEEEIKDYAGPDYMEPQKVWIEDILFDDFFNPRELANTFATFCERHTDHIVEVKTEEFDYGERKIGFSAFRLETKEEIDARVAKYRRYVEEQIEKRRAEYERMKIEFEFIEGFLKVSDSLKSSEV